MTLLLVEDLSLSIGRMSILRDIALSVDQGEIVALTGESGCGKSTVALSIMRLLTYGHICSGRILFDGMDLRLCSETTMCNIRGRDISMVFQEPLTALNPIMTVGDQVMESITIHDRLGSADAWYKVRDVFDSVGLLSGSGQYLLDRYPHELSGGQRQRVCIAMAIIMKPRLLLADEPLTALDAMACARIRDVFRNLVQDQGMGLLLITHDLSIVSSMTDRFFIMRQGELVENCTTRMHKQSIGDLYTKSLFEAATYVSTRSSPVIDEREKPVLEVSGVVCDQVPTRRFSFMQRASLRAVDHVDFTIHREEIVGLVGESGCGKSTLSRAILGLEDLQEGYILVDGKLVNDSRKEIQSVFQDPYDSFDPRHKVKRLVAEPFYLLGKDAPQGSARAACISQTLEMVGLTASDSEKYIHEFSGGQRQRIAIARALVIRPSLIVLDESLSSLDMIVRARILDLLAVLSTELSMSYLFVSHDLHIVRSFADRVLVMKEGKLVEHGKVETVFNNPSHPYTRELISAALDLQPNSGFPTEDQHGNGGR